MGTYERLREEAFDAEMRADEAFSLQAKRLLARITVAEVCALARRSKTGFYADVKAGVRVRGVGYAGLVGVGPPLVDGDDASRRRDMV